MFSTEFGKMGARTIVLMMTDVIKERTFMTVDWRMTNPYNKRLIKINSIIS